MKVFFSYARGDSEFVLRLAEDMRSAGVALWIDQLDIPAGARWDQSVENALKDCPRLLIILSPLSVVSQNVMDEVAFAISQNKTIVPILYRNCEIPFRLSRLQHVDFTLDYDKAFTKLLAALGAQPSDGEREPVSTKPPTPKKIANKRIPIVWIIAILLGILAGGLIANWDKVFRSKTDSAPPDMGGTANKLPPVEKPGVAENPPRVVPEGQPWVVVGKYEIVQVNTSQYKGSKGYRYAGEGVRLASPDNIQFPRRSRLLLLENGTPLGPRASSHADIQEKGEGRYSHWADESSTYLYFSTSDNSDPRDNKRAYVVTVAKE